MFNDSTLYLRFCSLTVFVTCLGAAHAQTIKVCDLLDAGTISQAIGKPVQRNNTNKGDVQKFEGVVLHTCSWAVSGTNGGQVILFIQEFPSKAVAEQGIVGLKNQPIKAGLRQEQFKGLGDHAEYAYWDSEPRAGITTFKGSRSVNITVDNVAKFNGTQKSIFIGLASKVLANL